MNEERYAEKIRRHLNFGLTRLDQTVLARLQKARDGALSKYQARQPVSDLAWAGNAFDRFAHSVHFNTRWLALAVLILALGGIIYWQNLEQNGEGDIDAALLADDLPVHDYLDKRFDAWLKR